MTAVGRQGCFKGGGDKRWYGLLLMAKGFGIQPEVITDAVAGLKTPERFNDYALYKADCGVIDAFFRTLREVYYPTMVTPTHYPSAHEFKSMNAVFNMHTHFVEFFDNGL